MTHLKERSRLYNDIRQFFNSSEYLEVDTPLLSPDLIPEVNIEVFKTEFLHPFKDSQNLFLIPSPEIWMKKLLASGSGSIYQICKSFRNAESLGNNHNPEFTMLEYYTVHQDYIDSISITEQLFHSLSFSLAKDLRPPFRRMTMEEACLDLAGLDLSKTESREAMMEEVIKKGYTPENGEPWETLFNRIFLTEVEPNLPVDKPLILIDYPAQIPCLAKNSPKGPYKERWELYVRGIELANCYTEETDPTEVKGYYDRESGEKEDTAIVRHPVDPDYYTVFNNFPDCSGVAMGLDRLLMVLTDSKRIHQVLPFPFEKLLTGKRGL